MTAAELVASGRAALAAGDLERACHVLTAAVEAGEAPAAHVMLGGLACADDDFAQARTHWEAAFRELRSAGELRAAARVAAELAHLHASALGNHAVGAGWLGRARRLLDRTGRCVWSRVIWRWPIWPCTAPTSPRSSAMRLSRWSWRWSLLMPILKSVRWPRAGSLWWRRAGI